MSFVAVLSSPNVTLLKSIALPSVSVIVTPLSVSAFSSISPFSFVTVIFPPLKSIVSPYPYSVLLGCCFILIDIVALFNVIFSGTVNICPFVALSISLSVYVIVKFCSATLVLLYPVTILSARTTGVFAPAFAYVTVYVILLSFINFDNSSLYFPVTLVGLTLMSVT